MLYGKLTGLFEVTAAGLSMALFKWAEKESRAKLALKLTNSAISPPAH